MDTLMQKSSLRIDFSKGPRVYANQVKFLHGVELAKAVSTGA